jgi:hypothetical protein
MQPEYALYSLNTPYTAAVYTSLARIIQSHFGTAHAASLPGTCISLDPHRVIQRLRRACSWAERISVDAFVNAFVYVEFEADANANANAVGSTPS